MKKFLLPESGNFYKANLHCHSTVSDGKLTPEELKQIYREKGYSAIAFTDHWFFVTHNELTDEHFVALNGYEMDIAEIRDGSDNRLGKTCHVCFIAGTPQRDFRPKFHDDIGEIEGVKDYSVDCISRMMETGREDGFFVTYNHPAWSQETRDEYCNFHGMHAMEICNWSSYMGGFTDYNEKEYDEMLRVGKRIGCIGADDNHNDAPKDSPVFGSFGAWTMIKADRLDYASLMDALFKGNYYASQGPEIHSIWVEGDQLHVECSPARRVYVNTAHQYADARWATDEKGITHARFSVLPKYEYIRITVEDDHGYRANSRAYFINEILEG